MMVQQKTQNVVPVTLAVLLHVALFGSLVVAFDFEKTPDFAVPLAINATLVTENAVVIPPTVEEPPKVAEPPPPEPQPDTREQERLAAEQQKREQDAREETARLQKIEQEKKVEAEKRRKEAAAEEERRRVAAEEKRQADIEAQRVENERERMELEAAQRQEALDEESRVLQSRAATAKSAYIFKIQQAITRHWVQPMTAEEGLDCVVKVQQLPGGVVKNVSFGSCNGDATVRRSIELAVQKASPLPLPRDPSVFDRNLELKFIT